MTNKHRAEELIKKYGFNFQHINKSEIIALIQNETKNFQPGSSEYIRLLCGYLFCIGDESDAELIESAKYKINFDVECMIDREWIDSLKGIESEFLPSRSKLIENFVRYYENFTADNEDSEW